MNLNTSGLTDSGFSGRSIQYVPDTRIRYRLRHMVRSPGDAAKT